MKPAIDEPLLPKLQLIKAAANRIMRERAILFTVPPNVITSSLLLLMPEKVSAYPEFSMFGELPAWGFYVRHVQGLDMRNVSIEARHDDYRPALVFDDVHGASVSELSIEAQHKKGQVITHASSRINITGEHEVIKK